MTTENWKDNLMCGLADMIGSATFMDGPKLIDILINLRPVYTRPSDVFQVHSHVWLMLVELVIEEHVEVWSLKDIDIDELKTAIGYNERKKFLAYDPLKEKHVKE